MNHRAIRDEVLKLDISIDNMDDFIKGLEANNGVYGRIGFFYTNESRLKLAVYFTELKKMGKIDQLTFRILKWQLKLYINRDAEYKNLNVNRKNAQAFIGKKNIRDWLFRRDMYKCLCCGSDKNLSVDHINPVRHNGENKLYNLQTLCTMCNSIKGGTYKDYR